MFSYVALLARLQKVSGESETWQRGTRKPAGDFLQAEQKTLAVSCTTFNTEAEDDSFRSFPLSVQDTTTEVHSS